MVIDTDEQFYFKPDAGKLLLSSADETLTPPCDAQADKWDVAVAIARVEASTTLQIRHVRHRWAGLRTFARDGAPLAGYDAEAPGFFCLVGQGGYRIQTAPALAQLAAALVLRRSVPAALTDFGVDYSALSPAQLSPERTAVRQGAKPPRSSVRRPLQHQVVEVEADVSCRR